MYLIKNNIINGKGIYGIDNNLMNVYEKIMEYYSRKFKCN